jgi:putative Mg2+ transporter-C (MgtC) family protein
MAGIGFLGAGTIWHREAKVTGLTTAAALWCTASVGLAAGMGLYTLVVAGAIIIVAALALLNQVEDLLPHRRHREMVVRVRWQPGGADALAEAIQIRHVSVRLIGFDRTDDSHMDVKLLIGFHRAGDVVALERRLTEIEGAQLRSMVDERE